MTSNCQKEIKNILSPFQLANWNRLDIPIVLTSEKVQGATLREFIIDGKFQDLNEDKKNLLCTQLGMSAALDLIFGNHDRIIHDTDRSNLGNIMFTRDDDDTLHCWLIDNGDVPSNFGENLKIQRKDYINEDSTFKKILTCLEKWRPKIIENSDDRMFDDFVNFASGEKAAEHFRRGISKLCLFFEEQVNSPESELNEQLKRIGATRLIAPTTPSLPFTPVGKYVPRHRRMAVESD